MTEDGSIAGMASDWLPEAYTAKSKAGCVTHGNVMSPLLGVSLD